MYMGDPAEELDNMEYYDQMGPDDSLVEGFFANAHNRDAAGDFEENADEDDNEDSADYVDPSASNAPST